MNVGKGVTHLVKSNAKIFALQQEISGSKPKGEVTPRIGIYLLIFTTFFSAGLFLAKPDSPAYPFSLFAPKSQGNYMSFSCLLVLEFWATADLISLFIMFFLIQFVYIFSAKYWMKYLCSNSNQQRGSAEMESCDIKSDFPGNSSLNLYHQLYILNTLQGLAFGTLFLPVYKIMLGMASTLTFYAIVKLGHILNLFLYLFLIACLPVSYILLIPATYVMSEIYNLSSKYQSEQLRRFLNIGPTQSMTRIERKLFLRNNKTAAIIRCKVGSLYWMEKEAKATLIVLLVSATSNMLLTFK